MHSSVGVMGKVVSLKIDIAKKFPKVASNIVCDNGVQHLWHIMSYCSHVMMVIQQQWSEEEQVFNKLTSGFTLFFLCKIITLPVFYNNFSYLIYWHLLQMVPLLFFYCLCKTLVNSSFCFSQLKHSCGTVLISYSVSFQIE